VNLGAFTTAASSDSNVTAHDVQNETKEFTDVEVPVISEN